MGPGILTQSGQCHGDSYPSWGLEGWGVVYLGTMTQAPLPSTELALRRGPVLRMWLLAPAVALQAHTMKANSSL